MSVGFMIDETVRFPVVLRATATECRHTDVIGDGDVAVYTHVFDIMTELSRGGPHTTMTKAHAYWTGHSKSTSSAYYDFEMPELVGALEQIGALDHCNIVDVQYNNPAEYRPVRYAATSEQIRSRSLRNEPLGDFPIRAHANAVQRDHYTVATFNTPRLELLWWNVKRPDAHPFLAQGNQGYTKLTLPFKLGGSSTVTHLVTIHRTEPIGEAREDLLGREGHPL